MDLAEFLIARIAEDEAAARGAWPDSWTAEGNAVRSTETDLQAGYEGLHLGVAHLHMTVGKFQKEARNATHIARWDPARVLAECEAKRRIVEFYAGPHGQMYVLNFLALPYSAHPDYRPEWAPTVAA